MTIKVGDHLPAVTFKVMGAAGPEALDTDAVFKGKTVVLFGVPGAFTPGCSRTHLPSYLEQYDALKAKGVDTIACVSVNDAFVMDAWAKAQKADDKILFLADGSAAFTKAIGMELDLTAGGLGLRSRRFSMVVKDGVVTAFHPEEGGGITCSLAGDILVDL